MIARSASVTGSLTGSPSAVDTDSRSPSYQGAASPAVPRRAVSASPSTVAPSSDDHQPVAGQDVGEPLPGLPLGVRGVGLPLELALQLGGPPVEVAALGGELRPAPPGRPGTAGPARPG